MFLRRGLLIHPEELDDTWLNLMHQANLNTLGLHPVGGMEAQQSLERALALRHAPQFQAALERAGDLGIQVEFEAHALSWLLPRTLFSKSPNWFRMDEHGVRTPDFHLCASNPDALAWVSQSAEALASHLWTGSHRWFLWTDDVSGCTCHCPSCQRLTPSDQALAITNAIARGVRRFDPQGRVAYLAYLDALEVPRHVQPEEGLFLEFAPIHRDHHRPLSDAQCEKNARETRSLRDLLAFFGTDGAQALDYWMDNSLFSQWKKPPRAFKLDVDVMRRDVDFYESLGFASVTSFGCYLGEDYRALYGIPPVTEYGRCLSKTPSEG